MSQVISILPCKFCSNDCSKMELIIQSSSVLHGDNRIISREITVGCKNEKLCKELLNNLKANALKESDTVGKEEYDQTVKTINETLIKCDKEIVKCLTESTDRIINGIGTKKPKGLLNCNPRSKK